MSNYVDPNRLFKELTDWQALLKTAKESGNPRPMMPDFVAESILKIAHRLSQKSKFVNYCVDEETEALTKRGWLKQDQLTEQDIILSYDIESEQLKWSPIHEIFRNEYDGKMFHLTGNGLNALVTPGHRFVTKERGRVAVEKLIQKDHLVLMGKPLADPPMKKYSDAFVKLVGWAVTEGSYKLGKTTHGVTISQKKTIGIEKIKECLEETGAKYSQRIVTEDTFTKVGNLKGMYVWNITGPIANQIIEVATTQNKVLTQEFLDALTQDQRLLLIDAMIGGDGHTHFSQSDHLQRFYYQKNKEHTDAFITLCTMAGIRVSYRLRKLNTPLGYTESWFINLCEGAYNSHQVEKIDFHGGRRDLTHSEHRRGEKAKNSKLTPEIIEECRLLNSQGISYKKLQIKFGVNSGVIHRAVTGQSWKHLNGEETQEHKHEPTVDYKGIVWCPRTDYGTFMCRRKGKVYLSSNSYKDEMISDSMESCMRYVDRFDATKSTNAFAYITQIIFHAFVRRILKEQKQTYIKMKIVDQVGFLDSYERQDGDGNSYNNSYVDFMKENKGDVISRFENWKERKKEKTKKKKADLEQLFIDKEKEKTDEI